MSADSSAIDQRIAQQRKRIHHQGDDSDLRNRLDQLKQRRQNQQTMGGSTVDPWSGTYESTVGNLNQQRDNTLLGIEGSEIATKKAYGFDPAYATSDPFSRSNVLQAGFQNADRGTTNNYAAAGQLYSGSLSNAHNIDRTNFEQSWDAAQKEYQSTLDQLAQRRLQAGTDYDQGLIDAEAKRLDAAVSTPVDPAEAPPQGHQGRGNKHQGKNKKQKGKGNH